MKSLTIERVTNGYKLTWEEEGEDEKFNYLTSVIEEVEAISPIEKEIYATNDAEKIALGRLFYAIASHYGFPYDKWNANNLSVRFDKKGHKVTDECPISSPTSSAT